MAFGDYEALRQIPLEPGDELLRADDAYRVCLEVICGLRSPLVGETEVFGQFKNAVQKFDPPATPWGSQFRRFAKAACEDAKKTRQAHLDNLGSQSYGSVVRREMRGLRAIHALGAGQLLEEMLPWLAKDGVSVFVYARNLLKAQASLADFAGRVSICAIDPGLRASSDFGAGLADGPPASADDASFAAVIAAPVDAVAAQAWLRSICGGRPRLIVDLRADSGEDRLPVAEGVRVLTLPDAMASVSSHQSRILERQAAALAFVQRLCADRARHVEFRPFGWDDVCA